MSNVRRRVEGAVVSQRIAWGLLTNLFGRDGPGMTFLIGVLLLLAAFIPPEPNIDEMQLMEGSVQTAKVVNDWYGRPKSIEFTLTGRSGRYWTDRVPLELRSRHSRSTHVKFFIQANGWTPFPTLSGAVKTYGLTVNGREVISVDHYLEGEGSFRRYVMAPVAAVMMALGLATWHLRKKRLATTPNNRMQRSREG